MSRLPRTTLPAIDNKVFAAFPAHIRSTPNGGRAWTCHVLGCQKYASEEAIRDLFLCKRHVDELHRRMTPRPVTYPDDWMVIDGRGVVIQGTALLSTPFDPSPVEAPTEAVEVPGVPDLAPAQPAKARRAHRVRAWVIKIKNVLGQPIKRFNTRPWV